MGIENRSVTAYWTRIAGSQKEAPDISGLDRVREIQHAISQGISADTIPPNVISSETIRFYLNLLPKDNLTNTQNDSYEEIKPTEAPVEHPPARIRMYDPERRIEFQDSDLLRELVAYWPARLLASTVDEKAHQKRYEARKKKQLGEHPSISKEQEFDEQWDNYWADITELVNRHTLDAVKKRWGTSKDSDYTALELMHAHLKESSAAYNALISEVFPNIGSLNQRNSSEWLGKYPSDIVKAYAKALLKKDKIATFELQRLFTTGVYSADHIRKREKDASEAKLSQIQQLLDRNFYVGDIEPVTIRGVYEDATNEVKGIERPGSDFPETIRSGRHVKRYETFQRTIQFNFTPEEARKVLEYYERNKISLMKRGIFITEENLPAIIFGESFTYKCATNPDTKERGSVLEKGVRKADIRAQRNPEDDDLRVEDVTDNERMEIMIRGDRTDAFLVAQKLGFLLCDAENQIHLANTDIGGRPMRNLDGTLKGRITKVKDDPNTNGTEENSKQVTFERIQVDVDGLEDDIECKIVSDTDFFMQKYHTGKFKKRRKHNGYLDAAAYVLYKMRRRRQHVTPRWLPQTIYPHVNIPVEEIKSERAIARNLLELREDAA